MSVSFALQLFLPFCFAPRLIINMKQHENKDLTTLGDMSIIRFAGELPVAINAFEYENMSRLGGTSAITQLEDQERHKAREG